MNFKKVFISELSPAKYNPRKDLVSSDPEYQRIKRSIEEFGYVDPIIVNSDYTVIGGHQRLKVLKELGHAQIDVVVVDIPKDKEKALNVALNKITGEWDDARLVSLLQEIKADGLLEFTGFDEKEFDGLLRELHKDDEPLDTEPQISRAEELRKEWGTELGQMWQCGEHRVIVGDCTDPAVVQRVMGGGMAEVCITDPPYSVDYENQSREPGRKTKKELGEPYHDQKSDQILRFIDLIPSDVLVMSYPINKHFHMLSDMTRDWELLYDCVWVKSHFAYIMGRNYQPKHEPVLIFRKKKHGKTIFNVPANASTVFEFDKPAKNPDHPTSKPVELYMKLVEYQSNPDGVVYEPFSGSGTTMIACENLGRKARGIEIDPGYVAVILERFKTTFPDKEIRLMGDK